MDEKGGQKVVTIVINGREHPVDKGEQSYEDIVGLANENPPTGANIVITVTYRRGHGNKPEGSLRPGESVKVKDGMVFNVTATDKS